MPNRLQPHRTAGGCRLLVLFKHGWRTKIEFAIPILKSILANYLEKAWETRKRRDAALFYLFCIYVVWNERGKSCIHSFWKSNSINRKSKEEASTKTKVTAYRVICGSTTKHQRCWNSTTKSHYSFYAPLPQGTFEESFEVFLCVETANILSLVVSFWLSLSQSPNTSFHVHLRQNYYFFPLENRIGW